MTSSLRDGVDPYEHLAQKPSELDRCPHCGGIGQVTADEELRFVCSLCGGPRFSPLADGIVAPEPAQAELRKVEKARKGRALGRGMAAVGFVGAALTALGAAGLLAVGALKVALVLGILFGTPAVLLFLWGLSRAKSEGAKIAPAIDAAWSALAAGAAHAGRAASPAALAKALGVDSEEAEKLHNVLAVDAEIGAVSAPPRVRVALDGEDPPPRSQLAPDPRFDALEAKLGPGKAEIAGTAERDAEAEAESAQLASAKTVIADVPGDPSRR